MKKILINKEQLIEDELKQHIIKHRVQADKARLVVFSDLHQGLNNRNAVKKTIDFILSVPECYVIIGSDSTNSITRHSKGDITEEWCSGDKQIFSITEDFKPLYEAGRLLAVMGASNHGGRVLDETYISPEMMICCLLGDEKLYKGEMGIVYFSVNKNCYVGGIIHKGSKREDYFDYMHYDFLVREHYHLYKAIPKLVIDHNKFTKIPIVKTVWDIWNGSYQVLPKYARKAGYRPQLFGTHFIEMDGDKHNRNIRVWQDNEFYDLVQNGYKI